MWILHISNVWILLRMIVIYLVGRKCYLCRLFCCWSWRKWRDVIPGICLITPGYFNIQTIRGFENFGLFASKVPIRFRTKWYIFSTTACFHYKTNSCIHVTSVNFYSKKGHKDDYFGGQDTLYFLSEVFKDFKYAKYRDCETGTLTCFALYNISWNIIYGGWVY